MVELIITKLIIKQTDARLLANNSQHCWILHVASACCVRLHTLMDCILPMMHCRSQHCWPNIVVSWCVRLQVP